MAFEIKLGDFAPQPSTVHFTSNKKSDGLRRLWEKGYTSFDENVLPGEDAIANVKALLKHLGRDIPAEFASLAVRYSGEQRGAGGILQDYGPYVIEVRHEVLVDALILNGDVKNLASDFVSGATQKPHVIEFDPADPTKTLQRLVALGKSRDNPRLTGNYPEARLLRRLRGNDVLAVWTAKPAPEDLEFLKAHGGVEVPVPVLPPKPPPFGRRQC